MTSVYFCMFFFYSMFNLSQFHVTFYATALGGQLESQSSTTVESLATILSLSSRKCHFGKIFIACHYNDVIMSAMASQITNLTIVYSTVYSRRISKKTSKLRVTGLCEGNSPVTGEFPAQKTSDVENVSI